MKIQAYTCPNCGCNMNEVNPPINAEAYQSEQIRDAIEKITDWRDKAYPLDIFPEPELKQVRKLLGDRLITLVSASNMRHVTRRVCEILEESLTVKK